MQIYSAYSVMPQTVKRRPGLHTLKASRFFVEREKKNTKWLYMKKKVFNPKSWKTLHFCCWIFLAKIHLRKKLKLWFSWKIMKKEEAMLLQITQQLCTQPPTKLWHACFIHQVFHLPQKQGHFFEQISNWPDLCFLELTSEPCFALW